MGLDMTLERHTQLTLQEDLGMFGPDSDKHPLSVLTDYGVNPAKVVDIAEEVCTWRKANQIHGWFSSHFEVENCQDTELDLSDLVGLLTDIETVLADRSRAEELLPPTAGFFFGSMEMEDEYWETLEETRKVLSEVVAWEESQAAIMQAAGKPKLHTFYVYRPWW
jgi:hypothetical protein